MQFPQVPTNSSVMRELNTSNMESLAEFLGNRNRRYTQLGSGKLRAEFLEVSLENVYIFQEKFNLATRIEAAPAFSLIPFGYITTAKAGFKFCGREGTNNTFLQASGGSWDLNFKDQLEYVGCAFNREYFCNSYEILKGKPIDSRYLASQFTPPLLVKQQEYANVLRNILYWIKANPCLHLHSGVIKLLCSQVFKLTVDSLPPIPDKKGKLLRNSSKRIRAAKRVSEYLQTHSRELPDMQTLCKVGEVSERSLQNGFIDYIGITPIQYLRIVRLNGVHQDLLRSCESNTTVTRIAVSWGFIELGRFSREYKLLFQQLPSETLRQ